MESNINRVSTTNHGHDLAALMTDDELHGVTGGILPFLAVPAGIAMGVGIVYVVSNYPGSDTQKAVRRAGKALNDPLGAARDAATPDDE